MKATYETSFVRGNEKASSGETHRFVCLLQLLYDGILLDGRASEIITNIHERRQRAGNERLDTLQCCRRGIGVSIEEERVARLLGSEFSRKGQDVVMVGGMRLRWVRGEKIEAEGIDDEEDGAFVGGR